MEINNHLVVVVKKQVLTYKILHDYDFLHSALLTNNKMKINKLNKPDKIESELWITCTISVVC